MTELFIDNQSVILQKEFSIQLIEENPFFTKNGKRTFDIDLSLKNETNAKIYKHYNRINNSLPIVSNRSARLVADNEVLLIGTEIILEITDTDVKLQLVSGESELNFLTSEKKINELDLGDISDKMCEAIPFFSTSIEDKPYDSRLIKYWTSLNMPFINCPAAIFQPDNSTLPPFLSVSTFHRISQPPFYHIVNKVIAVVGYNVVSNVLQSTDFKYLYLLNGNHTINYNSMLPGWTVSEFFEEIEKLFNVIILVDEHSKTVDIRFRNDYYNSEPIIFIDKVSDAYIQKIDTENRTDYSVANTGYDTDSDKFFKFQNLDTEILKHCEKVHFTSFNAIVSHFNATTDKDSLKNKIFVSDNSNTQYICYLGEKLGTEGYYPKKVNAFEPIRNNPDSTDIDIKFKIKPAPMAVFDLPVNRWNPHGIDEHLYDLRTQMPAIPTLPFLGMSTREDSETDFDIQSILEGETSIENHEVNDIYICFYQGTRTIYEPDMEYATSPRKIDYPMAFVDFLYEYNVLFERKIYENNLSLRLNHPHGFKALYDQSINIDTTREYTFKFITSKKLNARSLFIFNNKKFACKEFRRSITSNGIDPLIEGVFYAVS